MPDEHGTDTLPELLSYLYLYVFISDDYATTPAIYLNIGDIYVSKGKFDQAIVFFNKAIEIIPDYADAYQGTVAKYSLNTISVDNLDIFHSWGA